MKCGTPRMLTRYGSLKTLLMIAYHFPPENAIGSARPFRFYKYAQMFGWTPLVVTASRQDPVRKVNNVHYIADPFVTQHRSLAWHCERALRRFVMPGQFALAWSRCVARFCESYINGRNSNSPIALYSTFPPIGTHLAALQVVRKRRVCWVADYRDPYLGAPYIDSLCQGTISRRLNLPIAKQIERKMIEAPALIIANTDAAAKEWKGRYPGVADRMAVIWNGFDPSDDLTAPDLPHRARKVLIHTGTLYGGRHTGPILASLDRLIRSNRLSPESVLLRFVGECADGTLMPADSVALGLRQGWIEVIRTVVPRETATAMGRLADGLLLVQPQSTTQVPGKLFEYIRIGRPILAFIRQKSPVDDILRQCGIPNVCIYSEDTPDEVDEALWRFLQIPSGPWRPSPWFLKTFDGMEQTRVLCSLIDERLACES